MKKSVLLGLALLGISGHAGATKVEFGVAYRNVGSTLWEQGWARLGVSDFPLLGGKFAAGVSNRAADLAYTRGLSLAPLGAATSRTDLAVTYQGGVRVSSRANASLGPVALNLGGAYFTTSALNVDPLAAWAFAPLDMRDQGWNADLTLRYRVSRTLVAVAGGEFGPQHQGFLGVEGRQELTRTLPLPADAEPGTEPDTENLGTLAWRVGGRAGQGVLGVTAGVTYATEAGVSLGLDGLLGPDAYGVTGSLYAPDLLGDGSTLRLYAAYEPWRVASTPLRVGLEAGLKAGPGQLSLNVAGGLSSVGAGGFGVKVGYSLPLDAPADDQTP